MRTCVRACVRACVCVCVCVVFLRLFTSALPIGQTGGSHLPYHHPNPAVHVCLATWPNRLFTSCLTNRSNRLFTSALPTGQTGGSRLPYHQAKPVVYVCLANWPNRLFTSALSPRQTGCSRLPCDLTKPAVDADDDPFTLAQMEKQLLFSHCCLLSGVNWMKLGRSEQENNWILT